MGSKASFHPGRRPRRPRAGQPDGGRHPARLPAPVPRKRQRGEHRGHRAHRERPDQKGHLGRRHRLREPLRRLGAGQGRRR